MRAVAPTIKPDDSGDQVANLQAALLFLLERDVTLFFDPQKTRTVDELKAITEALLDEASAKLFDKTTRALTLAFQQRQGLLPQPNGAVDKTTADALNDRLREYGVLDGDKAIAVKGRVLRQGTNEPQSGVRVRAFAFDAAGELALGESETDSSGSYRVDFSASLIRVLPDDSTVHKGLRVRAFRPDGTQSGFAQIPDPIEDLMVLDVVIDADGYVVTGCVTDTLGGPRPGIKVLAYDRDYQRESVMGQTTTDEAGHYRITFPASLHRKTEQERGGPELFVRAFDAQGLLLAQSRTVPNAGPSTELNLAASDELRVVHGTVVDETGRPLPGLQVRAFDRDLRDEEPLGQSSTDAQGRYQIAYTAAQFRRAEKASADLRVRVLSTDGKAELAVFTTVFNAPAQAQVDLTVAADKLNTDSEWERYGRELAPLLGFGSIEPPTQGNTNTPLQPHELTDEDLDFVHGETGIDLAHLRMLRQAARWAIEFAQHKLPAEAFYALLRQGLSPGWTWLLQAGPTRWGAALKQAVVDRQVPEFPAAEIDTIVTELQQLAINESFKTPPAGTSAFRRPVGLLLTGSSVPPDVQRDIAGLLLERRPDENAARWWQALSDAGIAAEAVNATRFALQADALLGGHLPTLQALQADIARSFGSAQQLASLTRMQWTQVAHQVAGNGGLPKEFDQPEAYADAIASDVERAYPTPAVMYRLLEDPQPVRRDVGLFLAAAPGFDLLRSTVDGALDKADLQQIKTPHDQLAAQLRKEVAVARIAPDTKRAEHMSTLLSQGYDSAAKVVLAGKSAFKRRVLPIAGAAAADAIYRKAKERAGSAVLHAVGFRDYLDTFSPVLSRPQPTGRLTRWAEMFGAGHGCECRPCESAHGPAAYLVATLEFLDEVDSKAPAGVGDSLADKLRQRRPDLWHLKLDCANAETPLPYIDLVIEHLERLALRELPRPPGAAPLHDESDTPQTTVYIDLPTTAARLRAEPQSALPDSERDRVYSATGFLQSAVYPWHLPFDRLLRRTQIDLDLLGVPAADMLERFGAEDEALARARLGLDAATWNLLKERPAAPDAVAQAWGFASESEAGWASLHRYIGKPGGLLQRSGLDAAELFGLLQSPLFASWRLAIDNTTNPCDITQHHVAQRPDDDGRSLVPLSEPDRVHVFDLLHRTLRLRLRLNWQTDALVIVLLALGVPRSDSGIDLAGLGRLAALSRRLGLTPEVLAQRMLALDERPAEAATAAARGAEASWLAMLELDAAQHADLVALGAADSIATLAGSERMLRLESVLGDVALLKALGIAPEELRYLLHNHDRVPALFALPQTELDRHVDSLVAAIQSAADQASSDTDRSARAEAAAMARLIEITGKPWLAQVVNGLAVAFVALADDAADTVLRTAAQAALLLTLKTCRLLELLRFNDIDVRTLAGLPPDHALHFNFNALPVTGSSTALSLVGLKPLMLLSRLQADIAAQQPRLIEVLAIGGLQAPASLDALTGWGRTIASAEPGLTVAESAALALKTLAEMPATDPTTADPWQHPARYARIQRTAFWLQERRLQAADAQVLVNAASHGGDMDAINTIVQRRYATEAERWNAITPAMDRLRVQQRDALLAAVLHNNTRAWSTADAVYEELLIDVQIGPCQLTSRIVQAHSVVQMFVQRCLQNLEVSRGVLLADTTNITHWRQWAWMKNYRVWEAARKVFLYPENWIEPDLRVGKSPFFEALENELLQGEITPDNVERAVRKYLVQLHEVSKLDVRALYEELDDEPMADGTPLRRRAIHMVGRTRGTPHTYYYRKRAHDLAWTPWAKIDLSIDADHLALAVHNRRPMLFWPRWQEVQADQADPPSKAWEMTLSVSTLEFGQWSAPTVSNDGVLLPARTLPRTVTLRPRETKDEGGLEILVYELHSWQDPSRSGRLGVSIAVSAFSFNPCGGEMRGRGLPSPIMRVLPQSVLPSEQGLVESDKSGPAPTFLRIGLSNEPERLIPAGVLTFYKLLESGGLGGIVVAALLLASDDLKDDLAMAAEDSAWHVPMLTANVEGYRVVPCQQYAQFDENQPYVLQHGGKQLLAIRKTEAVFEDRPGGIIAASVYVLEAGEHPFVCDLLEAIRAEGIDGIYRPASSARRHPRQLTPPDQDWVARVLSPNTGLVDTSYPIDEFNFSSSGAYSLYNWELFFHMPLLLAEQLRKNQRFEDAQRWFHSIFDPMDVSPHPAPQKYWRAKPLFEDAQAWSAAAESLEAMMRRLWEGSADVAAQVAQWRSDPFNPHALASLRLLAYMKAVVQKYVENLIEWGDSLFRRDTMESINEATQLYVLAGYIMGDAPVTLPSPQRTARSYHELLEDGHVDAFANALIDIESGEPLDRDDVVDTVRDAPGPSMLYFCIPGNPRLGELRATAADRLFKIRHCRDIDGRLRQLALFAPPIDPALLVRARAVGLDIGTALGMALEPRSSHYRFQPLLQKALEFCGELRSFGGALLSALEKRDGEQLSQLRARHEVTTQKLALETRKFQLEDAETALEVQRRSRTVVEARLAFYQRNLEEDLSPSEQSQQEMLHWAHGFEMSSSAVRLLAGFLHLFPNIEVGLPPSITWGGSNLGASGDAMASSLGIIAQQFAFEASMAGYNATYERRRDEWAHQIELATRELAQIDQQIVSGEIRVAISRQELATQRLQIGHSEEAESFLRDKFTNAQLYSWMAGQLSALHYQSYRMAFDLAVQAEGAARDELNKPDEAPRIIGLGHWDAGRKGLLAGERLAQDLRRLEVDYMQANTRRLELSTHLSLRRIDAIALMNLRVGGDCEFTLTNDVFEMDFPGLTNRRIKSLSVSVPGVVGPYTGVHGILRLISPVTAAAAAAVIATSTGQNDAGVFQLDFRDERYLPFEGTRLDPESPATQWRFTLPVVPAFDYNTIGDLILHVQYTAAQPGDSTPSTPTWIRDSDLERSPRYQLIDIRHDFPDAWRALQGNSPPEWVEVQLRDQLFPYQCRRRGDETVIAPWRDPVAAGVGPEGFKITRSDIESDGASSQQRGFLVVKYELAP